MSTNALTAEQSFQEKMKERIRAQIGDLMPEEMLKAMVEKAVQEAFFTRPRKNKGTEWHPQWVEEHSFMERTVHELLAPHVTAVAQSWLDKPENMAAVERVILESLARFGGAAVADALAKGLKEGIRTSIQAFFMGDEVRWVKDILDRQT